MKKILLIEDNIELVGLLEMFLETSLSQDPLLNKFKIDKAYNGAEALELFNQNFYDIVVTDIDMPIMNGFEMLNILEKMEVRPFKQLIVTSGAIDNSSKELLKKYTIYNKPYQLENLLELIINEIKK